MSIPTPTQSIRYGICAMLLLVLAPLPLEARSLGQIARYYGYGPPVDRGTTQTLKSPYSEWVFSEGQRRCLYNGTVLLLQEGLLPRDGDWHLSEVDLKTVVDPLLRSKRALARMGNRVVVIDAGHGGEDGGAKARSGMLEKDVALDISKRVQRLLKASSVTVYLTRSRDETLTLGSRPRRAAVKDADVFLSIHLNAASSSAASGFETYIMPSPGQRSTMSQHPESKRYPGNRFDAANTVLGYYVHRDMQSRVTGIDRGLKRARFKVLREAPCPAALVECGFLSNRGDQKRFEDAAHRDRVARGIASGLLTYLSRVGEARRAAERLSRTGSRTP